MRDLIIEQNIVKDYLEGLTNKTLSLKYNLHRGQIRRILLRNNVKLKSLKETSTKYFIKENYFENIDCDEKAYILGLLYADGNVYKNIISISLIDQEIIEKIAKCIFISNFNILEKKFKTGKKQYVLNFFSKKMKNDLLNLGCMNAKTFKIRLPNLRDELMSSFLRGYFDGDGCLHIPNKKPANAVVTLTSNILFCNDIITFINPLLNINLKLSLIKKNNFMGRNVLSGRKQIRIFLDWLYSNSTIHLSRKYEKFKALY